jgi:hypothetical protein
LHVAVCFFTSRAQLCSLSSDVSDCLAAGGQWGSSGTRTATCMATGLVKWFKHTLLFTTLVPGTTNKDGRLAYPINTTIKVVKQARLAMQVHVTSKTCIYHVPDDTGKRDGRRSTHAKLGRPESYLHARSHKWTDRIIRSKQFYIYF